MKKLGLLSMVTVLALGATACGSSDKDISVVSREEGSGTRGAFVELFEVEQKDESGEKVDYTKDDAIFTNSTSVMMTTIASDEDGIGYISLGSLNDTVKALEIDGVYPSVDNVNTGDYKIVRPFNICTNGGVLSEVADDFLNFILSENGQSVVTDKGYIAVEDLGTFTSSLAEGKVVAIGRAHV